MLYLLLALATLAYFLIGKCWIKYRFWRPFTWKYWEWNDDEHNHKYSKGSKQKYFASEPSDIVVALQHLFWLPVAILLMPVALIMLIIAFLKFWGRTIKRVIRPKPLFV